MKTTTYFKLLFIVMLFVSSQSAKATVLFTEKFKNSSTAITPASNGWIVPSTQTAVSPPTTTLPAIINVSAVDISDTLHLAYVAAASTNGKTYGKLVGSTFGTKTVLYLAFKVKVTEFGAITNNQAIWSVGLGKSDFSKAPIKIGFEYTTPNGTPVFNVGISKGGDNNNNRARTVVNYPLNTNLLLVAKYVVTTTSAVTDDVVTLYINPVLTDVEPATASLAAPVAFADFVETDEMAIMYRQAGLGAKITDVVLADSWADLAANFTTGVTPITAKQFTVAAEAGKLKVICDENTIIDVYDALGKKIASRTSVFGTTELNIVTKGLHIVRVGNQSVKVVL